MFSAMHISDFQSHLWLQHTAGVHQRFYWSHLQMWHIDDPNQRLLYWCHHTCNLGTADKPGQTTSLDRAALGVGVVRRARQRVVKRAFALNLYSALGGPLGSSLKNCFCRARGHFRLLPLGIVVTPDTWVNGKWSNGH